MQAKRNTFDYFIHKDLEAFLRRELDFYIKNEVMRLDDIEEESAPRVEQYLSKIKVIRRIAHKIIDFLAQIENFQKKLWLKKKFVVETNYCVTLDRVPEELYSEIATNDAQREEWVRLFAIDEIEGDLHTPAYAEPLTVEFLKANAFLVLDTKFFGQEFQDKLLASFDVSNFEESCNGLLIHSNNLPALDLIIQSHNQRIRCVVADPPYNTDNDVFIFKDSYRHSSWIAFMRCIINRLISILEPAGSIAITIGEEEFSNLEKLMIYSLNERNYLGSLIWQKRKGGGNDSHFYAVDHDYIPILVKNKDAHKKKWRVPYDPEYLKRYKEKDNLGRFYWDTLSRPGLNNPIIFDVECPDGTLIEDGKWQMSEKEFHRKKEQGEVRISLDNGGHWMVHHKVRQPEGRVFRSIISDVTNNDAANEMGELFDDKKAFSNPKPVKLFKSLINLLSDDTSNILDCFAGSGTTAHAVINLNREDGGKRKYILVEMGEYFDSVTKPRIQKVIYSKDWKNGKPVSREGVSHMFKYIRLESYEDALANIKLQRTEDQQRVLFPEQETSVFSVSSVAKSFRESYMLKYMLDVESRGSQTLLNIDNFDDPWNYKLLVGAGSVGETKRVNADLVETFNWLLGLKVRHIDRISLPAPQSKATRQAGGFQVVEGENPKGEKVLVIWRKIHDIATENTESTEKNKGKNSVSSVISVAREKANRDLEEFFTKQQYNTLDSEFDVIYVNGDNNLLNVSLDPDKEGVEPRYKVRLIEAEFKRLMFDVKEI